MIATLLLTEVFGVGTAPPDPPLPNDLLGLFRSLFPAFALVSDVTVSYYLDRAVLVTGAWGDDYPTMLHAAHHMTLAGLGTGAESEMALSGTLGFQSIRSGALSLDRGSSGASGSIWASTHYGRQFLPYLRANVGGPRVTGLTTGLTMGHPSCLY